MSSSQPSFSVPSADCVPLGQLPRSRPSLQRSHPYTRRNNRHYDKDEKHGTYKTRPRKFEDAHNVNSDQGTDEFSQMQSEIGKVREAVQAEMAPLGGLRAATRKSCYKLDNRHIQATQPGNTLENPHECKGKMDPQEEKRALLQALAPHRLQRQEAFESYKRAKQQHLSQQKIRVDQHVNVHQTRELLAPRKGHDRSSAPSQGSLPPFQNRLQLSISQPAPAVPGFASAPKTDASYYNHHPDVKMTDAF